MIYPPYARTSINVSKRMSVNQFIAIRIDTINKSFIAT